jgi:hypothetical protein
MDKPKKYIGEPQSLFNLASWNPRDLFLGTNLIKISFPSKQAFRLIGFPVVQAGKLDGKVETEIRRWRWNYILPVFLHLDEFPGLDGNPSSI